MYIYICICIYVYMYIYYYYCYYFCPSMKPWLVPHQSSKVLGNSAEIAAARPTWIRNGSWTHKLS